MCVCTEARKQAADKPRINILVCVASSFSEEPEQGWLASLSIYLLEASAFSYWELSLPSLSVSSGKTKQGLDLSLLASHCPVLALDTPSWEPSRSWTDQDG